MKSTLLLTGGSGLLAVNWARCIRDQYNVVLGMHNRMINISDSKSIRLPLSNIGEIVNVLKLERIEIVIHTVAITNIEKCEEDPELAEYVNVELAKNVAIACKILGILLVHISTDQLFQGDRRFVSEDDPVSPINVYGMTKAKSEEVVAKENDNALIVRTNFYGWGMPYRKSFSDIILEHLRSDESIMLFNDVFYTPIFVDTLVKTVHELIDMNCTGVFNVVSNNRVSKYNFGIMIAKIFSFDSKLIIKSHLKDRKDLVKRPFDMSLSSKKIKNILYECNNSVKDDVYLLHRSEIL